LIDEFTMSLFRADLASLITTTRKLALFVPSRFMSLSICRFEPRKFYPLCSLSESAWKVRRTFSSFFSQRETRSSD